MFTGLIDGIGVVTSVRDSAAGREIELACAYEDLTIGESIACNGACLTVRECGQRWFRVSAVITTRERTTIGEWDAGRRINLERAMLATARFGGHIVQGHVDGVGTVVGRSQVGDAVLIDIEATETVAELLILHGSIAVDGVSMTVNDLAAPGRLQISVIDHTLRHTTLGQLQPGDRVHVEGDILGKYVRKLLAGRLPGGMPS